jgi:hypothetical protein
MACNLKSSQLAFYLQSVFRIIVGRLIYVGGDGMKSAMHMSLCLALVAASIGSAAIAAAPMSVIGEHSRSVTGGRALQVMVAQSEIKADINPSNIAVAMGGGLLGGLLSAAQNASRTKKAEAAIEPLRVALTGFDADSLAVETTKAGLANVAWMQPVEPSFAKDSSLLGKSSVLDSNAAAQVAFIEYSYDVSPDFSSIRVVAKVEFANKLVPPTSAAKPESRLFPKNLIYAQTITSVVLLPTPAADIDANAAIWSENGGKAARAALTQAFLQIQQLLPRALALSADDIKVMTAKDKKKGTAGGFAGRIQETTSSATLLWSGGFIHVQTLS